MYTKFTCSSRVEIPTGNKHVFYSSGVYFSADSNSTYKHFFAHRLKEKQKSTMNFKGTAVSAIT